MSITAFREIIHVELEKDLGIKFERGRIDGPNENYDVGSLWLESGSKDGAEWHDELHARVFKLWAANAETPVDPADLEALVETIIASVKDIQTSPAVQATGAWMFSPDGFEIDLESNGVEVVFTSTRLNPFWA